MAPMMRLILGLGALVLILSAVALGLPAHVTVTRSVVVNAPEYAVFPYLNDLRRFSDWSPWSTRDPNLKVTYSGPQEGKGAKVEWESDQATVGTGNIEIIGSEPSRRVDLTANINGLAGTSAYELTPAGAGSKVNWSFGYETGSSPIKRWKALMLDGFVGAEYQRGLNNLKAKVEEDRRSVARPTAVQPQPVVPQVEEPLPEGEIVVPETEAPAQQQQAAPADPNAPPPPPRR
jgi:hypothetical protein